MEQIYERLFAAKHPLFGSPFAKMVATLASRVGNWMTNGGAVQTSDGAAIRKHLLSLRNAVVVFDDLERAAMPVSEIMGYVNTLVEHERLKAILVANEEGLAKAWPEFVEGKEKLVARTVMLRSSSAGAYDHFVERMRTAEAARAAERSKDKVLETFRASGRPNLRSLRVALDDFDRLVNEVDAPLRNSDRALEMILPIMVAMWISIRAGEISGDVFDDGMALFEAFSSRVSKDDGSAPSSVVAMLLRHETLGWSDVPAPLATLACFASSGELDVGAINHAAAQHPSVVGMAEVRPWRRLWRWRNLSVTEFEQTVVEIRAQLAQFELRHPEELLHLLGIALDLKAHEYTLFEASPLAAMTEYADKLLDQGLLIPSVDGLDSYGSSTGLGYSSREDPEFSQYRDHLLENALVARDLALKEASGALLRELESGNYQPLHEYGPEDGKYALIPILHHLDVAAFSDILLHEGTLAKGLPSALVARYRAWGDEVHPLAAEADWIDAMFAEVTERAGRLPAPHRKSVLENLELTSARVRTALRRVKQPV